MTDGAAHPAPADPPVRWRLACRWLGAFALLGVVSLRALVEFLPENWLQTDFTAPRTPDGQLGYMATVITIAIVGLLMIGAFLSRDLIRKPGLLLTLLIGASLMMLYGFFIVYGLDVGVSLQVLNWGAHVAILGLAAWLGNTPIFRRFLIAGLLALLPPLLMTGMMQRHVEHAITLEEYRKDPEGTVRSLGIKPGSIQHRKFEERLSQPEARATFPISNLFASILVTLLPVVIALAAMLVTSTAAAPAHPPHAGRGPPKSAQNHSNQAAGPRTLTHPLLTLIFCLVALLGLWLLIQTRSKGAIGSLVIACFAGGLPLLAIRWARLRAFAISRWLKWLPVAAPLLVILIVLLRVMMGPPPTPQGERSLLFRAMYWEAAAKMMLDDPRRALIGSMPFQWSGTYADLYLIHKNPLQPEAVSDPHNVFVTYLVGYGLLVGCLPVILILRKLHQARHAAVQSLTDGQDPPRSSDPPIPARHAWLIALALTLPMAIMQLYFRPASLMHLPMMAIAWMASALLISGLLRHPRLDPWLQGGLLIGAVAAVTHNQIDMAMTHIMAAPALWLMLGLAAAPGVSGGVPRMLHFPRLRELEKKFFPRSWYAACFRFRGLLMFVLLTVYLTPSLHTLIHREIKIENQLAHYRPMTAAQLRSDPMTRAESGMESFPIDVEGAILQAGLLSFRASEVENKDPQLAAELYLHALYKLTLQAKYFSQDWDVYSVKELPVERGMFHYESMPSPLEQISFPRRWMMLRYKADLAHRIWKLDPWRWYRHLAPIELLNLAQFNPLNPEHWDSLKRLPRRIMDKDPDGGFRRHAIRSIEESAALNPYDVEHHLDLADLLLELRRPDLARRFYARVLILDDQTYLDPNAKLDEAARNRAEQGAKGIFPPRPAQPVPPGPPAP